MLGASTAWYSRVGAGPLGRVVLEGVGGRGVDVTSVRVDPERPTGMLVKSPEPSGPRIDYYRGGSAAAAMNPADLLALPVPRVVHTSGVTAALSNSCRSMVEAVLG